MWIVLQTSSLTSGKPYAYGPFDTQKEAQNWKTEVQHRTTYELHVVPVEKV